MPLFMAHEIFVDTSGFYALLIKKDDRHVAAGRVLRDARQRKRRFVTSDYVLDETATLLKSRGHGHLLHAFFEKVLASQVCRIEWTDPERFHAVQAFFLKHADQPWSFTDCVSFRIMKELRLREALTKDKHFHEAGFVVLLQ
jgi:predicted nucleic acid-binding protein